MEVKNVEKREKSAALLTVSVTPEEFEKALTKAYNKAKGSIQIPGFRKGKAPRKIVERMYGEGVFYEDAINELAPEAYYFAVEDKQLKTVAQPTIEDAKVEDDKSLTLMINAVLYPEVELGKYKGLEAVRKSSKVEPAEVEAEIDRLRERNATVSAVDRPAKMGDTVLLDYEGFIDGVPFDGGKGENYSLELGSNSFIPGFELQLTGTSAGEETEVNVTFPENYNAEHLAGKPAVFKCKIHEVREKKLPEADDEFAKDVSEFDTIEEYRKSIEEKLLKSRDDKNRDEFLGLLLEQIVADMKADVNEAMIDERADAMIQDVASRIQNQGIAIEQYLQWMDMTVDDFKNKQRENAEKQLMRELALYKIAELENIEVTDEDKEKEYAKMAEQYGMDADTIKKFYSDEMLSDNLLYTKAAEFVTDNAVALPEPPQEEKKEEKEDKDGKEE
ncbi:MAG: trigger factor [Oscillospiraceae bacterium]|nr:trigger factor [Oscillospiraceae bacterium]